MIWLDLDGPHPVAAALADRLYTHRQPGGTDSPAPVHLLDRSTLITAPAASLVADYGTRWQVEPDLRTRQLTLRPALVSKELVLAVSACHLRAVMRAAAHAVVEPRRLSFAGTQHFVRACAPAHAAALEPAQRPYSPRGCRPPWPGSGCRNGHPDDRRPRRYPDHRSPTPTATAQEGLPVTVVLQHCGAIRREAGASRS